MYIPERFQVSNQAEVLSLIEAYPFATVISINDNDFFVSHLPLILEIRKGELFLLGHLAKANPHWKLMKDSPAKIIFHGPHSYIIPKWYSQDSVPTWNYASVHLKGQAQLIEDEIGILKCLSKLTSHIEKDSTDPWTFWIPDELKGEHLCANVVSFEIKIHDIQAKFKLSQNRSEEDRRSVIYGLEKRSDQQSHQVANLMRETLK